MSKVGVGARKHEPEVIAKMPIRDAQGTAKYWKYQARCSCGWRGADRASSVEAHSDEAAHMEAQEEER